MTIILFIFLLLIIIVIHEAGHLLAAKIFNVYCYEFSFGMGPLLLSKQKKETKYCLRAIPIGGYVMMAGDNDEVPDQYKNIDVPDERKLANVSAPKKLIIMFAGIFMNIVLSLVIVSMILLSYGQYAISPDATINQVMENTPAQKAGLLSNDQIVKIELSDKSRFSISDFNDLSMYMSLYDGEGEVILTVKHDGIKKDITVKPTYNDETNSYLIGITGFESEIVDINIFNCFKYAIDYLATITISIFSSLLNLFRGVGLSNLSGPVGIYSATKDAVSYGFSNYMNLMAIISINVGICNLLPLPALDGGRMLITCIECVIGRPISKNVIGKIMTASLIILLLLFVLTTFNDVIKLF